MVMSATVERRGFTVDEYHRMGEVGILGPEERTELIEGVIVRMSPIGGWHNSTVTRLAGFFWSKLMGRAAVQVQGPVRLSRQSEPQPDLAVLEPSAMFGRMVPTVDDVFLLVEVADTTLAYDRETKVGLYAAAGVPEVWVVDLNGDRVLVFRGPTADGYLEQRTVPRGEAVTPMRLPDVTLAVADIIG